MTTEINNNELHDCIVVMCGIAKGHEFIVDQKFCSKLVELGNGAGSVKVRINHPAQDRGDVLSIVGEISGFYLSECVDNENITQVCVKAKSIKIYDLPDYSGDKIIALAKQASKFFGLSIDAMIKLGKKTINGFKVAIIEQLNSVDIVDTPAATPSLFSYALPEEGHIQLSTKSNFDTKVVNNDNIEATNLKEISNMANVKQLEEVVKKDEVKKDEEVKQVLSLESFAKKLEEFESRMKAYEGKETPKEEADEEKEHVKDLIGDKEVKADSSNIEKDPNQETGKLKEEDDKEDDKKLEAKMEEIATRKFTSLLAKTGGKVQLEDKQAPTPLVEDNIQSKLNDEQKQLAKQFGLDEVLYAKNIEAARKATQF